jgi:RNA polymerase primary sigma factor
VNISSYSRTVIEGERTISACEIFVREVLQNSLDAVKNPAEKVGVQFRIRTLQGGTLTAFKQAMNWGGLQRFVSAASRASNQRMDRYRFPDPVQLERNPIRLLEISESNTIGLIGPDRMIREEDYHTMPGQTPKAYRALCRDDARREKVSLGSGGTFGLGKAVLWRASSIQTVLFFSRLSNPYDKIIHRAAGQARLCTHLIPPVGYRGIGFGGKMDGVFCAPLENQEAVQFARNIGVSVRSEENSFGTTILIPFWDQPKAQNDDENVSAPVLLAKYAARFFWPAIVSGRLEVTAADDMRKSNAEA